MGVVSERMNGASISTPILTKLCLFTAMARVPLRLADRMGTQK